MCQATWDGLSDLCIYITYSYEQFKLMQIIETMWKFNRFQKTNSYSFCTQRVNLNSAERL